MIHYKHLRPQANGVFMNSFERGKCTKICFHWQKLVKSPKASKALFYPCLESTQFKPINWLRKGKKSVP